MKRKLISLKREEYAMKQIIKAAACSALALAVILGITSCGAASADAASGGSSSDTGSSGTSGRASEVTVVASSTVSLVPDKASVSFGVTTQETTAEAAQTRNSEAVNDVIAVLTGRGIEETSIRTSNYNMYPQYDYSERGDQRIIGYVVTTSMTVRDQDIEDLGELLSACVAAGINSIDNISLLCSGYDEAYRQALAQAVADARLKAEALAEAAGRSLGEVLTITEGWQDTSARYGRSANFALEEAAAMDAGSISIQPGQTEIAANVTVTYRMN